MLVAATDRCRASPTRRKAKEIPTTPPAGKNTFRLIGVERVQPAEMKDHTVVIRGLLIKDKVSRLNVTSVVEAVASCAPGAPK